MLDAKRSFEMLRYKSLHDWLKYIMICLLQITLFLSIWAFLKPSGGGLSGYFIKRHIFEIIIGFLSVAVALRVVMICSKGK